MKKAILAAAFVSFLFTSALALAQTISVNPSSQSVLLPRDAQFTVDITGVSNLYGFQFDIAYNPSYLDDKGATSTIPDITNFLGDPSVTFCVPPDLSTPGLIRNYGCTRQGGSTGITGNGVLATVNLSTVASGTSSITIQNVKLSTISSTNIPFSTINNGQVSVGLCSSSDTPLECRDINNEPRNQTGQCSYGGETCVSGQWNGICNNPPPVLPSAEVCDGVDNDCDGVSDGNEPGLTQQCGPLNETGLCQFGSRHCTDSGGWGTCAGQVDSAPEACPWTSADEDCDGDTLEHRGNVNCNCAPGSDVDIADLTAVATYFGTSNSGGDLNSDGTVDIFDLVIVGSTFGNNYC